MYFVKLKNLCFVLAAVLIFTSVPLNANLVQASTENDYILSSELDTIFDLYKDVAAYSVPEFTGNYKAAEFADTMVDLYPFNYLYCKFVNDRSDFHGLLYTIAEAKDAFGSDNENVLAAEKAGRSYYAPGKDNSFRYEENVTDADGVAKDAWFTDAYYRADKKASAQGGMAFGVLDGSRISENDSGVSFVFEYLDNDTGTIKLQYINTDWTGGGYVGNECTISKTGTGLWKTAVVPVNNARLCPESNTKSTALCSGREDFLLKGNNMYISRMMVVKNSDMKPISTDHEPVSCPKTTITDPQSGRTYYFMQADGKNAISTYVTSQCWNAYGTKFIVGTTENKMYEYDTVNETLKFLDYASVGGSINAFVTPDNHIYYIYNRCVYRINWDTYAREAVCFLPSNCTGISNMHVTSDGKYISGYYYGNAGGNVVRLNTQTGTLDAVYKKNFSVDNENSLGVGHPIINPVYEDIIFFCNEGTTTLIPDRLWMLDVSTGEMQNIFKQSYNEDGTTAECSGHEVWSKDGEYLYFVKYTNNQQKGQNGVVRIPFKDGKFTGEREYINGDAAYWHCYPSGDNNWVAADTNEYNVYLMSTKNHESMLLADFDKLDSSFTNADGSSTGSNHPYQPHPHISYNNKSVSWQMVGDKTNKDSLGIGWMDISDITGNTDYTKNEYTTGSFGKAVSYENTKSESTTEDIDGTAFVKAQNGNSVYFDIDDSFLKTVHQQLKLTFTAYSASDDTLNIGYTSGVHDDYELHKYEDKYVAYDIASGINTYTIDLGYVNVNNICKYATDLYFKADSGTTYVSNIIIEPYSDDSEFDTFESDMIYSFAGDDLDYCRGLQALSDSVNSSYTSRLFHVDDKAALSYAGITADQITTVKDEGFLYIANGVDGAWNYRTVTDSDGVTKNAWFTTRNKRVNTTSSYLDIVGQIYFRLTNDVITADDNELIVTVEYLDNRTEPFTILYLNNTTAKTNTVTFTPSNTGKWKTETHIITDAMISSTNSGTGLAKGYEDFRFQAAREDLYVSKIIIQKPNKQYVSDIVYTNNGSNCSSAPQTGNVAVTASVTNKTAGSSTVNVYSAVFDKFGDLIRVVKTDDITLDALESKDISANAVKVDSEEILKVFVWNDEMYPYELPEEKLNFKVDVSGTTALLTWDSYNGSSDYTYEIYCDGKLSDTVSTNTYSHTGVSSGKHTWHIEVTDFYGKYIYRSADAKASVQ